MPADDDVITTLKHPAVADARQRLGQVGREGVASFLADGQRLVAHAIEARADVEAVFFLHPVEGPTQAVLAKALNAGVDCHIVTRGIFFRLLGLGYETSVRVLAVVRRPRADESPTLVVAREDACYLVGERIQDPRNVGVMVRTADAWGLPCIVFGGRTADPYSRAAVRSSTGSIFRVPVVAAHDLPACLTALKDRGTRIIGTSAKARRPCWEADLTGPCAIVVGNESTGLTGPASDACDERVTIPMSGGASSFNVTVAAGILLYERMRQRILGQ